MEAVKLRKLMAPVGPVAGQFIQSNAYISGIMGPVGGGKTVAGIARCFKLGFAQHPIWDPMRKCFVKKCRIAVVRDTYPNIDQTILKTWHHWVPKDIGNWSGDAPRTHNFTVAIGKRGQKGFHLLDMFMFFVGVGDRRVEDVLRGLEVTGLWLNEMDLLPRALIEYGVGRVRWPAVEDTDGLGMAIGQIWGDFNAPDEDNWCYDLFANKNISKELEEEILKQTGGKQTLIEFYEQPGGLDENAENLHNLPSGRGYYVKQAAVLPPDKKGRLVDNIWGAVINGSPVYPEFSRFVHVAKEDILPIPGLPLRIGMDAGLTPAAVIAQKTAFGQTVILDELATFVEEDEEITSVGPTMFGEALADLMASRYPGFSIEFASVDPAAGRGTDNSGNELNWLQIAAKVAGIRIKPAPVPNNDIHIRLEAVRNPLRKLLEGARPALIISPRCKILRRGFNGGYKYRRTAVKGKDDKWENTPVKNQYSHVHDALQYLMVASGEGRIAGVAGGGGDKGARRRVTNNNQYNPFG